MGCCMSSTAKRDTPNRRHCSLPKEESRRTHAAVATPIEEETVKEVLSETPIVPKPPETTPSTQHKITHIPTKEEEKEDEERTPEISQASEMYSVADSYSSATTATTTTTTTTVSEVRDDEVTSKKRVNRSSAKVPRRRPYNGDRNRGPKPLAGGERQPVKRQLSGQARTQQRNVGSSRVGRDLGERSGRWSRSPETRTTVSGAVKSCGGGSPAKVAGKSGSKPATAELGNGVQEEEKRQNDNVLIQPTGKQSIENPHVSLECFIFL